MKGLGVVLAVALSVAVAAPALADEHHPDAWQHLAGTGSAAQSCPSSGASGVSDVRLEAGALTVVAEDGAVAEHAVPGGGLWPLADRYDLVDEGTVAQRGRSFDRLVVSEGDTVRAEVLVDPVSSAPLAVTTYDGAGEVHCSIVVLEWDLTDVEPTPEIDAPVPPAGLPDALAGFALGGVTSGDGFVAGLYGDGVFTFSLARWDRPFVVDGADGAGDELVEAVLGPGRTLVSWPVGTETLVLIGDLPPDVRSTVLAELPEPDAPGLLSRIWSRIFG